MASEMTVHCTMVGTVLYCPPVVHALPSALGHTLSDWVRRAGVAVATIGTAVAAPEGTALIWHKIMAGLRKAVRRVHVFLARYLPFLRRSATIHGAGGLIMPKLTVTATLSVTPGWDPRASLEARVTRLHEQMDRAFGEIEKARQAARDGIAEVRQVVEEHAGELRAAHQAHQAEHAAAQRQAAQVDARGVALLGLGVIMTGIPDELAYFWPVGWVAIGAGLGLSAWWACQAWSERRTQAHSAAGNA